MTNLGLIWGAKDIDEAIGTTERATFHMLESGSLPGAKKIGGRWCFDPAVFRTVLAADHESAIVKNREAQRVASEKRVATGNRRYDEMAACRDFVRQLNPKD